VGLGDLVLDTLKKVVDYIIELADDFADVLKRGVIMIIQHLEVEAKPDIDKLVPEEFAEMPFYKNLKKYVEQNAGKKPVPFLSILQIAGSSAIGTGVGMGMGAFGRDLSNWYNSWRRPTPLDIPILAYAKQNT